MIKLKTVNISEIPKSGRSGGRHKGLIPAYINGKINPEYTKMYYNKHKKQFAINHKKYREIHVEEFKVYRLNHKEYQKNYSKTHRKIHNSRNKKYRKELKLKVFKKYGFKCSNPYNLNHGDFLNDIRCLQIDHVNGNGVIERKKILNPREYMLKVLADKEGNYQLLCANCNWIKRHIDKECIGRKYNLKK